MGRFLKMLARLSPRRMRGSAPALSTDAALYHGYASSINVYAHPTTAQGTGSGTSEGNATTLADAYANAVAGDYVGILPGVATGTDTGDRTIPAWRPTNEGSSGNLIRFIAKYPWAHASKTEYRNDSGSPGFGCPVGGASGRNYISHIGIYTDQALAASHGDTGPFVLWDTIGSEVRYCRIIGDPGYVPGDNNNAVRMEGDTNSVVADNTMSGFFGLGSNGAPIMTYGSAGLSIVHNDISDCYTAIYIKGTAPPNVGYNHGTVAFNRLHNCTQAAQLQYIDTGSFLDFEDNLIYDAGIGIYFHAADQYSNVRARRNSIIVSAGASLGTGAYFRNFTSTSCIFDRNIVKIGPNTNNNYIYGEEYLGDAMASLAYNGFYASTATNKHYWNGSAFTTLAAFEAACTNAANNLDLSNDPFSGSGGGDYTVTGQAATAGPAGVSLGADYSQIGPR